MSFFKKINLDHILEGLDQKNRIWGLDDLGRKIIRYIGSAIRPMTLYELAELLSIEDTHEDLNSVLVVICPEKLMELCGSLVRIDHETNTVFLAHYSVKEYLVSERVKSSTARDYYVDGSETNMELAKASLHYLAFKSFSVGPFRSKKDMDDACAKYKFLGYAANYGGEHLGLIKAPTQDFLTDLLKQLKELFVPPIMLEDYTDDPKINSLLHSTVFACDLNDSFTDYGATERQDLHYTPYVCFNGELGTSTALLDDFKQVVNSISQDTSKSIMEKSNCLSWLQVYRYYTSSKAHPANITPLYYMSLFGWHRGVQEVLKSIDGRISGSDINHALRAAAIGGHKEVVELLVSHGADVNSHCRGHGSALQASSYSGHKEVVSTLVDLNASLVDKETFYRAGGSVGGALQGAVMNGNEGLVKLLIEKGANINNPHGWAGTPLMSALGLDGYRIANILIDGGADGSIAGGYSGSPLISCNDIALLSKMLDKGADVNRWNGQYGGDALQYAARSGNLEKVRFLLARGADLNAHGGQYGNAIQTAAVYGQHEVLRYLLKAGADPNSPASWIGSPFQLQSLEYHGKFMILREGAGFYIHSEAAFFGPSIKAGYPMRETAYNKIRIILENEPTSRFGHYGNPLQAASFNGSSESIEVLLSGGALVNAGDGFYGSALQAAAVHGHDEAVKTLLKHNADPNARGGKYHSALHGAAAMGHLAVVDLLLCAGAQRNFIDDHGWTAKTYASHFKYTQVVDKLIDNSHTPSAIFHPKIWSEIYKSPKLKLDCTQQEVTFCGKEDFHNLVASVQADHPVPPNVNCYYFEVQILDSGESRAIAIGFSDGSIPLHRMPGWDQLSWGFHGDDGYIFTEGNKHAKGPKFDSSDVVGYGINWDQEICFFTKNGSLLDAKPKIKRAKLLPMVGIVSEGARVLANFGDNPERPFMFDVTCMR